MKRKRTKLIWLSAALCAVCVAVMVFALAHSLQPQGRFIPPEFDRTAVKGAPALTPEEGYGLLDAGVYAFGLSGVLELKGDQVDLWLANLEENEDVWIKVVIRDMNDVKLGETGLIRPGEYVQSVKLTPPPTETDDVKMIVMGYEPETYYSVGNVTLYTTLKVPQA